MPPRASPKSAQSIRASSAPGWQGRGTKQNRGRLARTENAVSADAGTFGRRGDLGGTSWAGGVSAPAMRPSRRYLTMVVASLSFIVLSCVAFLVPVPYVTMRPGPAFDTLGTFNDEPMF